VLPPDETVIQMGIAGTGFFIDSSGLFLTADHVMTNAPAGSVHYYYGRVPDEVCQPAVEIEQPSADATFNTPELSTHLLQLFGSHFGSARVVATKPIMASEDFSRFWLADKSKQSVIFWVGGVPKAKWDAVNGDTLKLPALHSSLWAPDADAVISTATEAMTVAALDILKKG